jgi:hypothetical protein
VAAVRQIRPTWAIDLAGVNASCLRGRRLFTPLGRLRHAERLSRRIWWERRSMQPFLLDSTWMALHVTGRDRAKRLSAWRTNRLPQRTSAIILHRVET